MCFKLKPVSYSLTVQSVLYLVNSLQCIHTYNTEPTENVWHISTYLLYTNIFQNVSITCLLYLYKSRVGHRISSNMAPQEGGLKSLNGPKGQYDWLRTPFPTSLFYKASTFLGLGNAWFSWPKGLLNHSRYKGMKLYSKTSTLKLGWISANSEGQPREN